MDPFLAPLRRVVATLELRLDASQIDHLLRHYRLLTQWNRRMNLTSITSPEAVAERHFGESLFLAKALPAAVGTLADVGSGAGFPGFPVAVARPGVHVTLVETTGKKAVFLKELTRPVANAGVLQGRFESLGGVFDCIALRGVSPPKLWPLISQRCRLAALLVSGAQLSHLGTLPGVQWGEPQRLPWGQDRFLAMAMFHVEH